MEVEATGSATLFLKIRLDMFLPNLGLQKKRRFLPSIRMESRATGNLAEDSSKYGLSSSETRSAMLSAFK